MLIPATISSVWGFESPVRGRELTSLIVPLSPPPPEVVGVSPAGAVVGVSPAGPVVGEAAAGAVVAVGLDGTGVLSAVPPQDARIILDVARSDTIEKRSLVNFIV